MNLRTLIELYVEVGKDSLSLPYGQCPTIDQRANASTYRFLFALVRRPTSAGDHLSDINKACTTALQQTSAAEFLFTFYAEGLEDALDLLLDHGWPATELKATGILIQALIGLCEFSNINETAYLAERNTPNE